MTKPQQEKVERRCGNCRYWSSAPCEHGFDVPICTCPVFKAQMMRCTSFDYRCDEWADAGDISIEQAAKEALG